MAKRIPKPVWKPGDEVILESTGEIGRVIGSWWDPKQQWYNVYVAFFGDSLPDAKKPLPERPYVLRYLETSLTRYKP